MLHDNTSKNRQIGILLASLATFFFAGIDASGKWLVQSLPVVEVVWFRFLGQAIFTCVFSIPHYGLSSLKISNLKLQLLRAAMLGSMTVLNFAALQYLQLAETGAVHFSVPLMIAVISSLLLKDHLPLKNWIAITVGFLGVLVILNPAGHSFHPAMLLALANSLIYAFFNLLSRKMAATDHPAATQLVSGLAPAIIITPFLFFQWQTPQHTSDWIAVLGTGVCGFLGHFCLAQAYRYAKANTLSPFFYQQILYMILLGWLFFNQIPDINVVIGGVVVIASGLYLLHQEINQKETA
jgi:drug/metabolite transporter (DMT)-like permease